MLILNKEKLKVDYNLLIVEINYIVEIKKYDNFYNRIKYLITRFYSNYRLSQY